MSTIARNIEIALRLLLALLFIFSGGAKSIDCVGTSLYVASHLEALHLGALSGAVELFAVLLGGAELALGILLLLNIMPRVTRFVAMAILALFTLVTLLNMTLFPLEDCGCFGDVVTLSTEATFLKNLILLPLSVAVWLMGRRERVTKVLDTFLAGLIFMGAVAVNIYTLRHLPLIDLLPYRVGTNLREAVISERELVNRSMRTELIFRGVDDDAEHRFAADCIECWMDDSLEYVGVESVMDDNLELHYDDFALFDQEGVDRALELLSKDGAYLWLTLASSDRLEEFGGLDHLVTHLTKLYPEHKVVVLSAVAMGDSSCGVATYGVDRSTLRSMIRADIGIMLIRDGMVEAKYNIRDLDL